MLLPNTKKHPPRLNGVGAFSDAVTVVILHDAAFYTRENRKQVVRKIGNLPTSYGTDKMLSNPLLLPPVSGFSSHRE